MKKLMKLVREEIVPLSSKQNVVLMIIIACVFQFLFFYAPTLAAEVVEEAQAQTADSELIISNGAIFKNETLVTENGDLNLNNEPEQVFMGPPAKPIKQYRVIKTSRHTLTAYNSEVGQTDNSPCITANGFNVCEHGIEDTVAANFLPMGTKIRIPDLFGDRIFVVRDRMNKKHPSRVDVWMLEKTAALKFGVKNATIEILEEV